MKIKITSSSIVNDKTMQYNYDVLKDDGTTVVHSGNFQFPSANLSTQDRYDYTLRKYLRRILNKSTQQKKPDHVDNIVGTIYDQTELDKKFRQAYP